MGTDFSKVVSRQDLETVFGNRTDEFWGIETIGFGQEGHDVFRGSGCSALSCTGFALQIRDMLGADRVQVVGWDFVDADPALLARLCSGHDVALVDRRFVVDIWAAEVEDVRLPDGRRIGTPVFDLQNAEDIGVLETLYGRTGVRLLLETASEEVNAEPAGESSRTKGNRIMDQQNSAVTVIEQNTAKQLGGIPGLSSLLEVTKEDVVAIATEAYRDRCQKIVNDLSAQWKTARKAADDLKVEDVEIVESLTDGLKVFAGAAGIDREIAVESSATTTHKVADFVIYSKRVVRVSVDRATLTQVNAKAPEPPREMVDKVLAWKDASAAADALAVQVAEAKRRLSPDMIRRMQEKSRAALASRALDSTEEGRKMAETLASLGGELLLPGASLE